jgi:hypothetical protein
MLTHVQMCEACCRKVWPALQRPSMQEKVLLLKVAAVLEQCDQCVSQAGKLKHAAQKSAGEQFWAWVSADEP